MADDPMPTRWSFQDFKLCYDAKFGRKKVAENGDDAAGKAVSNGNGNSVTVAIVSNGNKRASEMAVYEQFRSEGQNQIHTNGFVPTLTDERPQKSLLPPFESAEMRALAESLSRDIIRGSPDVKWESIKGLENAKRLLKEAVVMPIKYPKYFTGLLSPWKGILLFGPPGTGKDSEKLVKVLFELARYHAPSTIFLDEIDAIISQRGEARSEHEASRRLKTELLIQMDGLTKTDELVFVLAATNLPWELDAAMLRRLEKRILVPLPEPVARRAMFEELLPQQPGEESIPYDILEDKTEGYSGSDIRLLCKETAMQPLRRLMSQLEQNQDVVPEEELPKVGPIKSEDIETALRNTRPSAHLHAHKYDKFNADYGSQILQ
ncbi:Katanin p60 ATPase-containing subunit A-like 2 [Glycine soja]|uniref:Katanin p60 ATPase-containing subunit A-like 2 n=1 Tax=Glycine soja TaxID=3848 RepID=A0A0B2RB39_GLYSO|nr:Katanin p60 ATPase-containing subunit A-like 2 [Glycine soja]